jgi:hypothetical protein
VHALSPDIDCLVAFLATVRATGSGDGPEDWVGAYGVALSEMRWRGGAKTVVHITDAPAHGARYCGHPNHEEEAPKLAPLIERVTRDGILVTASISTPAPPSHSKSAKQSTTRQAGASMQSRPSLWRGERESTAQMERTRRPD